MPESSSKNTYAVSDDVISYTPPYSGIRISATDLKPFVKWAGGKKQLLPIIHTAYPEELGSSITKYAEPFIGGGAVLFDLLSSYRFEEVYISDVNAELINTYKVIRDNCEELISSLRIMQETYLPLNEEERRAYFGEMRTRFNHLKTDTENNQIETAALFIFLNRTCFNGLYRVNSKNEFNVPVGRYKNPAILNEQNLKNISAALKNVRIICGDFRESLSFIDENTFVYLDPPYRPLSITASFTSYAKDEFNDESQKALAEFVREIDAKGAKILLSNSDPKNTCPEDNFFDDLYAGFSIKRISASRMINSKAEKRGKINELLISNYYGEQHDT